MMEMTRDTTRHFVVIYNRRLGELRALHVYNHRHQAFEKYWALSSSDPDIEVVVLSAGKFSDLLRTHGRYFYTLSELAAR
jgi:hypothetical protein